MTCENFRSRIAEMFDSEHIANDMWKHIAECDNCRNYYAECCATVNFITPKAKIPTPNFSTKKSRRSRWHFSRSMRRLSYAALTIMAALLAGIAVYHYDLSDTAHAATQAFSKASLAMSEAENFTATIMVRTRPQDNFNFIVFMALCGYASFCLSLFHVFFYSLKIDLKSSGKSIQGDSYAGAMTFPKDRHGYICSKVIFHKVLFLSMF